MNKQANKQNQIESQIQMTHNVNNEYLSIEAQK